MKKRKATGNSSGFLNAKFNTDLKLLLIAILTLLSKNKELLKKFTIKFISNKTLVWLY